jgi:hypothetical protein
LRLVTPFLMPKTTKAVTPLRLVLTKKQSHRCDTLKILPGSTKPNDGLTSATLTAK